jgi:hypothetical protein
VSTGGDEASLCSFPSGALRAHNKTPIYAANIGCAGKPHHHREFILEMRMHGLNPLRTAERRAIERRTSQRDGTRSQRQSTKNVLAPVNSTIDDNRNPTVQRVRDWRQGRDCRWRIVKLATGCSL